MKRQKIDLAQYGSTIHAMFIKVLNQMEPCYVHFDGTTMGIEYRLTGKTEHWEFNVLTGEYCRQITTWKAMKTGYKSRTARWTKWRKDIVPKMFDNGDDSIRKEEV